MRGKLSFVLLISLAVGVCSCGWESHDGKNENNEGKDDKHFYYHAIYREVSYGHGAYVERLDTGLAILYGDDNAQNYLMFNDEEDYYNDYIYEWSLALKIANDLYFVYYNPDSILDANNDLQCVCCLPNCLDVFVTDEFKKEQFLKCYYDVRDAGIYQPEKGYGYRKYPIDAKKYGIYRNFVMLFRTKGFKGVPDGALGIRFLTY